MRTANLTCTSVPVLMALAHAVPASVRPDKAGCIICGCQLFKGTADTVCSNSNGLGGVCNHEYDEHYDN